MCRAGQGAARARLVVGPLAIVFVAVRRTRLIGCGWHVVGAPVVVEGARGDLALSDSQAPSPLIGSTG